MPAYCVLHVGNAFTFYCFHDDGRRHTFCSSCLIKRSFQLIHIVAVCNIDHMEIESFKFLVDRVWGAYICNITIDLKSVIVHDHNQVVQFAEACEHSCLPYLSFLDLAVSKQCVYTIVIIAEFGRKSHTCCSGDSLSKRTTGHINTRDMLHIRMSLKIGAQMTKCFQILFWKVSSLCKYRVKSRCCMSFGKDKTVTVCLLRILRIDVHLFKI